ncbi:MAG: ABC transporter ATP-binding protein, partial [Neglectibacter timonensis]
MADRGMTVLIASHNLRELEDFCDTIALLHRGGVLLEKELDSLRLGIHRIQAVFLDMPELPKMKEKIDIVSWERSGSVLSFVARGELEEILGALEQFGPQFQEAVPLSLEEVFISEMEAAGYDINNIVG